MEKIFLSGAIIGCIVAFFRFLLDDKWQVIPKDICRFCVSWWFCFIMSVAISGYMTDPQFVIWLIIKFSISTVIAMTVHSFAYIYIKNAN